MFKKYLLKHLRLGLIILIPVLAVCSIVVAAPPDSPFSPGETLDPDCSPGDVNCTIIAPAVSTRQIDATLPLSGGGDLTGDRTISLAGLSDLGTADYILGVNSDASGWEYKSLVGTADQITVSLDVGLITLSLPQDISITSSPSFAELKILESGDTPTYYGIFDTGDLSGSNKTYTFPDVSGDVSVLGQTISVTELASADFGELTCNGATCTIDADTVALSTDTTGNYVATIADSGGSTITVNNSGSENAGITIGITANSIGDTQLAYDTGQNLTTASTPQFARSGLGAAADSTNILTVTSTSTTDLSKGLNITHSGAITGTGYAGYFSKTGVSTTNVAGYFSASGATNNYGLIVENGRVGVGVTTPASLIHALSTTEQLRLGYDAGNYASFTVASNGALTITPSGSAATTIAKLSTTTFQVGTSTTAGYVLTADANGVGTWQAGSGGISGSGSAGQVAFWSGASALSASSNLYWNNIDGRLGIGTTGPDRKLDVLDASNPQLRLTYADGTTYADFQTDSNGDLIMNVDGISNQLVLDNGGNVGIGTASPQAALDVGTGQITGGTYSATRRNYLDLSSQSSFYASDFVFPNTRILFAEVSVVGTYDNFIQFKPKTTSDYGYLEAWNAAGLIVGTGGTGNTSTAPIIFRPNRSEVARITVAGNLGIGTTSPDSKIEIKGGTVCVDTNSDDNATSCIANESDIALKTNVNTISGALDKVMNLRGVEFDWRVDDPEIIKRHSLITRFKDRPHDIGLIAQEVEVILPEALGREDIDGFKQLNYNAFIPVIIEAIKEQQTQISALGGGGGLQSNILTLSGDGTFSGKLAVEKRVVLGKDSIGESVIKSGAMFVHIAFDEAYENLPVVTVSPMDFIDGAYKVGNTTVNGFDIVFEKTQGKDVRFSWHAFESASDAKVYYSDGVVETLNMATVLVLDETADSEIEDETLDDQSNVEESITDEQTTDEVSDSTDIAEEITEDEVVEEDGYQTEGSDLSTTENTTDSAIQEIAEEVMEDEVVTEIISETVEPELSATDGGGDSAIQEGVE